MRKIALLAAAAAAALSILGAAPAHAPHRPSPGSRSQTVYPLPGCPVTVYGHPGIASMTLHITNNPCGIPVKSEMICEPVGAGLAGAYWAYGGATHQVATPSAPVTDKVKCGKPVAPAHIPAFAFAWSDGRKPYQHPWHWVAIGPVPGRSTARLPRAKCDPHAWGHPGIISTKIHLRRDPCGYVIRANVLCWYPKNQAPGNNPGDHYWQNGPLETVAPVVSRSVCAEGYPPPQNPTQIVPWGYQYQLPGHTHWYWSALGPVAPGQHAAT